MTPDFISGKVRNLQGNSLENVGKQNDYGIKSENLRKNYIVQSCGKHNREDMLLLGVRSLVGKLILENLEKILSWLSDDKINKIGVFGMGGCGKTTLAVHVYNRILQSNLSRVIVWVTVGMNFDVHKLQLCISRAVGLDLENEKDETKGAARLHDYLSKSGRYVLILDNLWEHYSFEKVGIPSACKVIITTRMLSICRRTGCQKTIKIGMLGDCEAWQLFCSVLEYEPLPGDDIGHIAQLVCQECAGLPLGIVHMARSLRGVNKVSEWKYSMRQLKEVPKEHDFLVTKHLYLKLHSSYARLANAKIKLSLLYYTLYPKDCKIQREELIRLWIAVGLIDEVSSLQAQYDQGHTIVNELVDSSLLETSGDGLFVKMHDVIRNMAVKITREKDGPRFLAICNSQLKEVVQALDFKEDIHAVSLMKNYITEIPFDTSPKCPKLSVLLLQHNPLKNVPSSFFLHMPSLRVLDLSNTNIQRLPDSTCELKNLRSLLLHCCQKLTYVPALVNLKALQMLDLGYAAIKKIPFGIERLTMLRELDLSGLHKLKEVGCGLLAMPPALKRISCYVVGGILQELQTLRSLEILDATFKNISEYNGYVKSEHWRVLDRFHLQVRDSVEEEQESNNVLWQYSNVVSFYGCSLVGEREQLVLPENVNLLHIDKCDGVGRLCDMLKWESKDSYWENSGLNNTTHRLDEAVVTWGGPLLNLEIVIVSRCHNIEKLFTTKQIMGLQNLEILEIRDCFELKELITEEDNDMSLSECSPSTVTLPNLETLKLTRLPLLSSIYKGLLLCTSLHSIRVDECPKLTRLPFSFFLDDQCKLLQPMLEKIEGQDEWWDSLELNQTAAKLSLQTLYRPISGGDQSQT